MIDKKKLEEFIEQRLEGTDLYPVEIEVSPDNVVRVDLDSDSMVDIDECVRLSREIEAAFDRDEEDYELEVGSVGITSPLKLPRQYRRYIGKEMEVITRDGKKLKGILADSDSEGFILRREVKVKKEGEKRPHIEQEDIRFGYGDVKETRYVLNI